jgi:MFS family permease
VLSQVAANGLTYNTFSLFLHDWAAEMHTPISRFQLSTAVMVLGAAALSPFIGMLADRYPANRLLACGLVGLAVFDLAISFTTESWQIVALYGLLAPIPLCLSTSVVTNTLISRWFVSSRGLALGLSALGVGMAGVVLPPLIAAILPSLGWRTVWRLGALVLVVVIAPIVFAFIRQRPGEGEGLDYIASDDASRTPQGGANAVPPLSWREIMARKNFWIVVLAFVPMMGLYAAYGQNIAPHAASHGLSQQSAGVLMSVFSLTHLAATFALGPISDRFGNRWPFFGLALLIALGALVLSFGDGIVAITIGCALVGLAGGFNTMQAVALAAEFGASGFGRAYGLSYLFIPFGAMAPFVVAKAQEATGSYAPGLLGIATIVVIGGGLALLLDEKRGPRIAVGH